MKRTVIKTLLPVFLYVISGTVIIAQQPENIKLTTELFVNYHQYFNKSDSSLINGFDITRAYFGYNFEPEGKFSGSLLLNLTNPDGIVGHKQSRNAFFREASITWSDNKLTMSFGLTSTRSTLYHQRFTGKRYLAESFENINKYSDVADLGLVVDYAINDIVQVDFSVMNGEGYLKLHVDNSLKTSAGISIKPTENIFLRLYSDVDRPAGVWQATFIGFAGYKNRIFLVSAEAARKTNLDLFKGHDSWGMSFTGAIKTTEKTEVFGRYDYITSALIPDLGRWNYKNDYRYMILGMQYTFNPNFRMALSYQGTTPYSGENKSGIFVNGHFRF